VAEKYADLISMYTRETTSRSTRGTKMNINRLGSGIPIFKLEAPKIEFFNNYNTVDPRCCFLPSLSPSVSLTPPSSMSDHLPLSLSVAAIMFER
jgi:hypothetical protein